MLKARYYWLHMYLKILEINVLKYINLILFIFLSATGSAWKACLKMTWVKLELLPNNDILKMVEKWVSFQICNATYRYAKEIISVWKNIIKTLNYHISCI